MQTKNMPECFAWLKEQGFMASPHETAELLVSNRGREDGKAAGSWVIDGNTPDETCARILRMMDDCDPALDLPVLQLGQWADDPSFADILAEIGIELDSECPDEHEDDLFNAYSDAWYEGMHDEVQRACLARTVQS